MRVMTHNRHYIEYEYINSILYGAQIIITMPNFVTQYTHIYQHHLTHFPLDYTILGNNNIMMMTVEFLS